MGTPDTPVLFQGLRIGLFSGNGKPVPRVTRERRGSKCRQNAHHAEGFQTHVAEPRETAMPLVQAGERLNLVANFGVAGQVLRFDPTAAEPLARLEFRPEVF
jgi:hypothetical protein